MANGYDRPHGYQHQPIRAEDQPFTRVPVDDVKRALITQIHKQYPTWEPQHIMAYARNLYQTTLTRDEVLSVLKP